MHAAPGDAGHRGFLKKMGGIGMMARAIWHERFVVVENGLLQYYLEGCAVLSGLFFRLAATLGHAPDSPLAPFPRDPDAFACFASGGRPALRRLLRNQHSRSGSMLSACTHRLAAQCSTPPFWGSTLTCLLRSR